MCKHTSLWETQGSLHLPASDLLHPPWQHRARAVLQTLRRDGEGVRHLTNVQRAHVEIGCFQSIDCLPSA